MIKNDVKKNHLFVKNKIERTLIKLCIEHWIFCLIINFIEKVLDRTLLTRRQINHSKYININKFSVKIKITCY